MVQKFRGQVIADLEQNFNWYSSDWLSNISTVSTLSSKEIWRCLFSQKQFRVKLCKWSKPFDIFGNFTFVLGAWNARKCDDLCSPYWLACQLNHVYVTCHSGLGIHGLPVLVLTLPVLRQKRIGFQPILVLPQSPLYYGTRQRPPNIKNLCWRFEEEDDYEIFSILSSARAWASVILARKRDSRHHSTTGFSENVVVAGTSYQM